MDVVGAVVTERREVETGEQRELLEKDRALAPRPALVDQVVAEGVRHRRLELAPVVVQILDREQAAVGLRMGGDPLGDLAAVEGVARGLQAVAPAVPARRVLGGDQEAEGAREIGIGDERADVGKRAARQVDRRRGRPRRPKELGAAGEREVAEQMGGGRAAERRVHREPTLGELQRRGGDLAEVQGPGARERREERVRCRGWSGRQHAGHRDQRELVAAEPIDRRGARRARVAVHREHAAIVRRVDEGRELAAERVHVRVHDALDEGRGDGRVDGVPPRMQHAQSRLGREVVLGDHHPARTQQRRSLAHAPSIRMRAE